MATSVINAGIPMERRMVTVLFRSAFRTLVEHAPRLAERALDTARRDDAHLGAHADQVLDEVRELLAGGVAVGRSRSRRALDDDGQLVEIAGPRDLELVMRLQRGIAED